MDKITVGLKSLRRQIKLCDILQTRLASRANDEDEVEVGDVVVSKRTAIKWANDLDGLANFISLLNAKLSKKPNEVVVYRGKEA